ncbi:protein disulfide-isomerase A4 [Biomphalaria glabrata]|uniref:Protein disulfide-isomerase n=1 Tax=Biomphalaria glabrata TaxID=6526 RepID=A0A9W2ZYV7_BIOGL|nr:protein disulfide-isomerase A4-like isoform X2 [Biomphalaria glabrata]KAI8755689.1 protein disulfide-isomerase A4-like [Biomphalaria glabrata]KAI8793216.1 protein disulfide-isomerase A4 [Biomphalaria glabrata]
MHYTLNIAILFIAILSLLSNALADADVDDVTVKANADLDLDADKDSENSDEGGSLRYEESVLVLNGDNFDDVIKANPVVLVEFYAPWCGHCKNLAPEYSAAAKELASSDPPVVLAKVDATVHSELAQRFDVTGYPTLKFFKNGKEYPYEGPRETQGIISYMKERAKPDWAPEPDAVVTLTQTNFDEVINANDLILVEFYAPWCGHCKRLAPTYEKAAKSLLKNNPPITLAKVDATKEADLAKKYEISGYPTLKIFRKGKPSDYKGKYESEYDIVVHMRNQLGDGAKEIASLKALKEFFSVDDVTVIGFFESKEEPLAQPYKDFSDENREDYTFGIVYNKEAREAYKIKPNSVVVFNSERFYTKYEPKWHVLEIKAKTSAVDVKSFIEKHHLPLVGHYHGSLIPRYQGKKPLCLVFYTVDFSFEHREATQFWRNKIAAIAKKFPDITFAVVDDETNSPLMEEFGLGDSGEDVNVGLFGADGKRYGMKPMEEFDSDDIIEFLNKYKKGKLKPYVKSQRAPKKQTGPVTVVVAHTFGDIVLDNKKDVLIELYAPWCGHCKNLEPIYNDLAKKLKAEKNLVIAKMDATANDLPDNYSSTGFPTIYFAPANNKKSPIKYEGERTLEAFEKFLKEQATVSFGKVVKEEL